LPPSRKHLGDVVDSASGGPYLAPMDREGAQLLMAGSTGGRRDEAWRLAQREEMAQAKGVDALGATTRK
jgi:hypothetical protein